MPLATWWLAKKDRYTYNGLIFELERSENEEDEINCGVASPSSQSLAIGR